MPPEIPATQDDYAEGPVGSVGMTKRVSMLLYVWAYDRVRVCGACDRACVRAYVGGRASGYARVKRRHAQRPAV